MKQKIFKTFDELRKEISKRDYDNVVGLKAEVTEEDYWYFLEVLPPIYSRKGGFLLMETLSHDEKGAINYWFKDKNKDGKYMCEIVYRNDHVKFEELVKAGMV